VNVVSATYAGPAPTDGAFERSVKAIGQARGMIDALGGELRLVLTADDIESVYRDGKRGLIIDFQETGPFGSDLDRIDLFYNLGLRVVQLTYNRRNLVGDGCTERYKTGLTYFGREVVQRLNEKNMAVDVSHCSEQVGWDAIEVSSSPVIVTHSAANGVCYHDRGKGDDLARAIAEQGGFFGVAAIGGFIKDGTGATLDDFADHVEHLVNVMGIDHVGIGTDKCGPGPGTESNYLFPEEMGPFETSYLYKDNLAPGASPVGFDWSGFRAEHRLSDDHRIEGFDQFTDWPNITVKLAERGFEEEELRKLLGLNYLRVFREIVG
jgi:membrane dipeptidase